jgi:transcriptional regulator with XRE-family HTH domain
MAQKYFKANLPKLENLRIARGWSREQLASKAILSTRTLDSIMAGKSGVLSTFSKLAKAIDTPVNALVDGFEMPQEPVNRCWSITINISAPYNAFDETKDLPEILTKLLAKVGGDELWGAKVSVGSTHITCYLTVVQYVNLKYYYEAGHLNALNITDFWYEDHRKLGRRSDSYKIWNSLKLETGQQTLG